MEVAVADVHVADRHGPQPAGHREYVVEVCPDLDPSSFILKHPHGARVSWTLTCRTRPISGTADLRTGTGASEALDTARFGLNGVIDGEEPFAEDASNWTSGRSAGVDHLTQRELDRVDLLAL
jgi:hypothetical protein